VLSSRSIELASWVTLGAFVVTIVPDAAGLHAFDGVAAIVALALFLASLPIWCYAFGLAVVRNARGDDVTVGNLFFLIGSAPDDVRRRLLTVVGISVLVAAGTAWANAFAALEPMMPLALLPLWGALHGTFPARPAAVASR
jgi:hypothetical protein